MKILKSNHTNINTKLIQKSCFFSFFFHSKTNILFLSGGEQDVVQETQEDELNYKLLYNNIYNSAKQ